MSRFHDEIPTDIERIIDRKLIKQRVHYFVMWKGCSEANNTWESRIDLMADGYSNIIKNYEEQRKKELEHLSPRGRSRGRSPGRLSSKSPRKSKSPGRGASQLKGRRSRSRSASVSRKLLHVSNDEDKNKGDTTNAVLTWRRNNQENHDRMNTVGNETSRRQSNKKSDIVETSSSTQFVSRLDELKADGITDPENNSVLVRSIMTPLVSHVRESASPTLSEKDTHKKSVVLSYEEDEKQLLHAQKSKLATSSKVNPTASAIHDHNNPTKDGVMVRMVESGYLASFLSIAAVVGSLVASQMLSRDAEEDADMWRRWLSFLTPVVALLLFFHQKDARRSAKWVATGLAWRAAAELLLLIEVKPREFEMLVTGSAMFANVSLLTSLLSIMFNGEHKHSKATLVVLATGTLALFLSDSWVVSTGNTALESRVILMSVAVMMIAVSSLPTAFAEDED